MAGALFNHGAGEREAELSRWLGIRIGGVEGSGRHLSHSELNTVEKVLGGLPRSDLANAGTTLRGIVRGGSGAGAASDYDPESRFIHLTHPADMPAWLYTRLNRGSSWQRRIMDLGAAAGYEGLTGHQVLRTLGCAHGQRRKVMSGSLAHGNLLKWTLRHEVGHAVDADTDWLASAAGREEFGGWRVHQQVIEVAQALMERYTDGDCSDASIDLAVGLQPQGITSKKIDRWFDTVCTPQWSAFIDDIGPTRAARLREDCKLVLSCPWMLDEASVMRLERNGRIYQRDIYGEWVSYSADALRFKVSHYQFSAATEWFAEAYAAYHDPKPGLRKDLDPRAMRWFEDRYRTGKQ